MTNFLLFVLATIAIGTVLYYSQQALLVKKRKEWFGRPLIFLDITIPYNEDRPAQYTDQLLQGLHTIGEGVFYVLNIHAQKGVPTSIRIGVPLEVKERVEAIIRAAYPTSNLVELGYRFPEEVNYVCFVPRDLYLPFRNYAYDKREFPTDPLSQTITLLSESVSENESIDVFFIVTPLGDSWKKTLLKRYLVPILNQEEMDPRPTSGGGRLPVFSLLKKHYKKGKRIWDTGLKKRAPLSQRSSPMTEEERELKKRLEDKYKKKGFGGAIYLASTSIPPEILANIGQSFLEQVGDITINSFVLNECGRGIKKKIEEEDLYNFIVSPALFYNLYNLKGNLPVFSTSEIATLWHIADQNVEDPNAQKGAIKELPPPNTLPVLSRIPCIAQKGE